MLKLLQVVAVLPVQYATREASEEQLRTQPLNVFAACNKTV